MQKSLFQRFLSLTLALALLLSFMPAPAVHAEEQTDPGTQEETTQVEVTFNLENSKVLTPEGEEIPLPYKAEPGSTLSFKVAPVDGYKLEAVQIGTNTIIADTEDVITVTVKEGLTISVTSSKIPTSVVDITLENSKILTPEGVEIPLPYEAETGSVLTFKVAPLDGCELEVVKIGTITVVADAEDIFNLTVKDGSSILVRSKDITDPTISQVTRRETGWTSAATYIIEAVDNIGIASITIANAEDPATAEELTADENGSYLATIIANGTYTVTVLDAAGNLAEYTITETEVDCTAPAFVDFKRVKEGMVAAAAYTFYVEDAGSGVASVTYQKDGEEAVVITPFATGMYGFKATANGEYTLTITDIAGNETSITVTETQVDNDLPVFENFRRVEEGWATSATYTFTVSDITSAINKVTLYIGKDSQELAPDENGVYTFTMTRNTEYYLTLSDAVGNVTELRDGETQIDNSEPVLSEIIRSEEGWTKKIAYTFTASDELSGVAAVMVQFDEGTPVVLTPDENGLYTFYAEMNGEYTVTVTDGVGFAASSTVTEGQIDTEAPVLSNIKRAESGWNTAATYSFTAEDTASGIAAVKVVDSEDTEIPFTLEGGVYTFAVTANGTYTITVTDQVGNEGSATVEETQIDTTAPAITGLDRKDEGWATSTEYTFRVNEAQSGISAVTVTAPESNTVTLTADPDGVYTFTAAENGDYVLTVTDALGNSDTMTVTETQIDSTAPAVKDLQRIQLAWATTATYTFTVEETQSGIREVLLTIGNGTPQALTPDNGVYTFTVTENCSFSITATDNVDLTSSANGEEAQIDTVAPGLSDIAREESGWVTSATYTFTASDLESGVAAVTVTIGSGEPEALTPNEQGVYSFTMTENGGYEVTVTDAVGNTYTASGTEAYIDTTAAEFVDFSRLPESGWATFSRYLFLAEDSQSGVASVTVQYGDSEPETLTPRSNGEYYVVFEAKGECVVTITDNVGNTATKTITETEIDTTKPVISELIRSEEGWATSVTYSFTVSDSESGVDEVLLLFGKDSITLTPDENGVYSFALEANRAYTITASDAVGNTAYLERSEQQIDTTAPALSDIARTESGWTTAATYTFTAEDALSGVASVTVQFGTDAPITLTPDENGLYTFTTEANGEYTVTVTDGVGFTDTKTVTETMVDTVKPEIPSFFRAETDWSTSATYIFTAEDTQSGIAAVTVQKDGGTIATLTPGADGAYRFTVNENGSYTVTVTDAVGNVTTHTAEETLVDTAAPEIADLTRGESGWATSATWSFVVRDSQSGVAAVTVTIGNLEAVTLIPDANGVYTFTLDHSTPFTLTAVDALGNTSTLEGEDTLVDVTKPDLTEPSRNHNSWATSATYTFNADDTQSGIATVTVQIGAAEPIVLTPNQYGDYTFTMNENADYLVTVTDSVGNTSTYSGTETHVDTTAATITTIFRQEQSWATSATYRFTAEDEQSGIASVTLQAPGKDPVVLTPNENGVYSFTVVVNGEYTVTVTDAVGNTSSRSVTETMVDTAAPVIVDLTRTESGWATSATYTFRVEESQSGIQKVLLTVGSNEPVELHPQDGLYTFTLEANAEFQITVMDTVDNTAFQLHEEAQVDTTAPAITEPVRHSDTWQTSGNYTFSVTDAQSGVVKVTVTPKDGEAVTLHPDADGKYQYVAQANTTYTVTATDLVGNTATTIITEALVDITAPSITDIVRNPDTWSQDAVFTFSVSDTQSGIASVAVKDEDKVTILEADRNGKYHFDTTANGEYYILASDVVGNAVSILVSENQIDLVAPSVESINPQEEWDADENTVLLQIADDKELVSVEVHDADNNPYPVIPGENNSFSVILYKNGNYTVTATDRAGNTVTAGFTVWHIDTEKPIAPVLESTGKELWVNTDVTVTVQSSDSQSGVVAYWYSAEGGAFNKETWTKLTFRDGIGSFSQSSEQDTVYYVVAEDEVGRISDASRIRVAIDKTAPGGHEAAYVTTENSGYNRIVAGRYIYNDHMMFTAKASDPASGVVAYQYRIVGADSAWIDIEADENGFEADRADLPDGIYTIEIRACDLAGNWSEIYTIRSGEEPVSFVLENTPSVTNPAGPAPDVNLTVPGGGYNGSWTAQNVTIQVSGSAAISGIESYEYRIDYADPAIQDVSWQAVPADGKLTVSTDTHATYYFRAVTYAGNRSKEASCNVRVQKSLPLAATLILDAATGTNGWYTMLPGYKINLPEQDPYMAPVHYEIDYALDGKAFEKIRYDGTNAPAITADGIWTLTVTTVDAAGNKIASITAQFKVDTKAPDTLGVTMDGSSILNILDKSTDTWNMVHYRDYTLASDFSIFKNSAVTIKASADGGTSGAAALYYMALTDGDDFTADGNWLPLGADGIKLSTEQKYCLFFKAVDVAGNTTYFSGKSIILDYTAPSGGVADDLSITLSTANRSGYGLYNGDVTVNISVTDPVIGTENVFSGLSSVSYQVFCDGELTQMGQLYPNTGTASTTEGRTSTWSGRFTIDAELNNSNHITVEVTATDKAGNSRTSVISDGTIQIDMDTPVVSSRYDRNKTDAYFDGKAMFTGSRTLTVIVNDRNFAPNDSFVRVIDLDTGMTANHSWTASGNSYSAVLEVSEDGHYAVTAVIADKAGNKTESLNFINGTNGSYAFVIDNTDPNILVNYDNGTALNGHYFNTSRTATVTVTERNFDPSKIAAEIKLVREDGTEAFLTLKDWVSDGNTHTASVLCEEEGTYSVTVSGADALGNSALSTAYAGIANRSFVVDKHIDAPVITDVENGSAYAGEIIPAFTAVDKNIDTVTVTLVRTHRNKTEDVTKEFLAELAYETIDGGMSAVLDVFKNEPDMDGVYTLTVAVTDLAGNTADASVTFSVNRFGSVYVYDDSLVDLIGTSVQQQTEDLIIREYNPSGIKEDSVQIFITVNGTPMADPIYSVEIHAPEGEDSGWCEYIYTISAENFTADGTYEVVVSTEDLAGNIPENTDEDTAIRFAVDTTAPDLTSIIGLEQEIYEADSVTVTLSALDNVALESIVVYLNGAEHQRWENIGIFSAEQSFTVPSGLEQHIRIVVTDAAGNVLDTENEAFAPGYTFHDTVTISTNLFLRFYANKPLFYGTIAGAVLLIGGFLFFFIAKKRKKEDKEPEQTQV